jgi:hypothetical protein
MRAGGVTPPPPLNPTLFLANPWIFHKKYDVTVILLLGVSFMIHGFKNERFHQDSRVKLTHLNDSINLRGYLLYSKHL